MLTPRYLFTLLTALFLATGCVTPYLKVHSSTKDLKDAPTLLVSAKYGQEESGEQKEATMGSLIKGAVKIASNMNLDEVGEHLVNVAVQTGEKFGFKVTPDKVRSQELDLIKGDTMKALSSVAQIAGGTWISPEGSQNVFMDDRSWLVLDSYMKKIMTTLKAKEGEYFLFVVARHEADSEYLFFERAIVTLSFVIFDDKGKEMFKGRGVGYGATQFWSEDSSPAGLKGAIDDALASMLAQPQEAL